MRIPKALVLAANNHVTTRHFGYQYLIVSRGSWTASEAGHAILSLKDYAAVQARLVLLFLILALASTGVPLAAQEAGGCEEIEDSKFTLDVFEPDYLACGEIQINGFVASELGPITSIDWGWGDGTTETSWFPGYHRYTTNGTYTVTITATANSDSCQQAHAYVEIDIPTADDPDCDDTELGPPDIEVRKSVDNAAPDSNQVVEFIIDANNLGEGPAANVIVTDLLPSDLLIPGGMAAFTSVGNYDPASGDWTVGEMEAGATETLSIPAMINAESKAVCIINSASADVPTDSNPSNNSSSATLRRSDIERCVDLGVEVTFWDQPSGPCGGVHGMFYGLRISNVGLDEARKVVLDVAETIYSAPGAKMDAPNCENLRCTWEVIRAGQSELVSFRTDDFEVQTSTEHGIRVVVSSDVEDYALENNSLVDQRTILPVKHDCGPDWNVGGAGGCFIATATYGSALHTHVQTLRKFRDNVLLEIGWGRALVEFYYRHSPDLANYIAERDGLRMLSRGLLTPIVFAVAYPWQALLVFVAAFCLLIATILALYRRRGRD